MDIVDADRQRASEAGAIAELPSGDLDRCRHQQGEVLADGFDQLCPSADASAEHDHLRVDGRRNRHYGEREKPRRFVDGSPGGIVVRHPVEQVAHSQSRRTTGLDVAARDASRADGSFECPVETVRRVKRIAAEGKVGDLAGAAMRAANDLAVGDDAQAEAGAEGNDSRRCRGLSRARASVRRWRRH